ncbi:hypothetical protein [Streptomyces collinus]
MCDIHLPETAADGGPSAPWGHSTAAHRELGWCSHCPGRGPAEEVIAWRTRANREHAARETDLLVAAAAKHGGITATAQSELPCPACRTEALVIITVTLTEGRTRRQVGGWAYCEACDTVPASCYCQPGDRPHIAVPVPVPTEEDTRG